MQPHACIMVFARHIRIVCTRARKSAWHTMEDTATPNHLRVDVGVEQTTLVTGLFEAEAAAVCEWLVMSNWLSNHHPA